MTTTWPLTSTSTRGQPTEEGHAGGVDGAQLSQVLLVVVFTQLVSLLQDLPLTARDLLEGRRRRGKSSFPHLPQHDSKREHDEVHDEAPYKKSFWEGAEGSHDRRERPFIQKILLGMKMDFPTSFNMFTFVLAKLSSPSPFTFEGHKGQKDAGRCWNFDILQQFFPNQDHHKTRRPQVLLPRRCGPVGRPGRSSWHWPPPEPRWSCWAPGKPAGSRWSVTPPQLALPGSPSPRCTWTHAHTHTLNKLLRQSVQIQSDYSFPLRWTGQTCFFDREKKLRVVYVNSYSFDFFVLFSLTFQLSDGM